ncbi:MAG: SIMPL domain-containing protein [Sphingobacteriales bacterium]|nr:SIMPL domain-containing protein [Sphingobacteriales bacterium]
MKNTKLLFFLLFILTCSTQLQAQQNFDNRKFIEVTGSAEMTIQPDEIELKITLVEYEKNGKRTVELKEIEKEFYEILKNNGINTNSLTLNNSDSWWHWWHWWSYRSSYQTRKNVSLKLNKETNFLNLVKDLDKPWVQNISIASTSNSDIQKYRKEVKIDAIKAAKEKATYLLESVGEQIGSVISIEEMPDHSSYWYGEPNAYSNVYRSTTNDDKDAIENVASIKLRYEIKAKFEIK